MTTNVDRPAAATQVASAANSTLWRGIGAMVVSTVAFASMHALIRHVSVGIHPFEIAFFRNLLGLIVIAPWIARYGLAPLRTRRLPLLSLRAVVNSVAMLAFFYGLAIEPLARVTALGFTAPVFATVLAVLFLGERVRLRRWSAILVGFVGMLIIVQPGVQEVSLGTIIVLVSAMGWAVALIIIKELSRTESAVTITAYMLLLMAPLSLVAALPFWTWPSATEFAWLAGIGILGTIAQLLLTQALKDADATLVMPFDFLKLIWASLLGYFIFAQSPSTGTWIGGAVIFAAATYIAYREATIARRAPSNAPGPP